MFKLLLKILLCLKVNSYNYCNKSEEVCTSDNKKNLPIKRIMDREVCPILAVIRRFQCKSKPFLVHICSLVPSPSSPRENKTGKVKGEEGRPVWYNLSREKPHAFGWRGRNVDDVDIVGQTAHARLPACCL